VDAALLPAQQAAARKLMERFGVQEVSAQDVNAWLSDGGRTTYLCDVRSPEEFENGSLPGAVHAPGGQLVQATDQWIGVRNARIVLIDGEGVRAPVVASWLRQLGCDAYVLEGGIRAGVKGSAPARPALPVLEPMSALELKRAAAAGECTVLELRPSMDFRKSHIPGSRWGVRPRLAAAAGNATGTIVLVADEPDIARLAAIDLLEAGFSDLELLEGGFSGWSQAGYATEQSPAVPPDAECIDYLFFVHDRHAGNREAMKQYLAWETGLIAQLDEQERAAFKIGPATSYG
jgi:rhodanese-related sulfurtransferase